MKLSRYPPSAQFTVIAFRLLLCRRLGVRRGAYRAAARHLGSGERSYHSRGAERQTDWQATLDAIEAENASSSLAASQPQTVAADAGGGSKPPTSPTAWQNNPHKPKQRKIARPRRRHTHARPDSRAAAAQVAATKRPHQYTAADLTIVPDSNASLNAYGNGVMQISDNNPAASEQATLTSIDNATRKRSHGSAELTPIGAAYQNMAVSVARIAGAQTLLPLHFV